MADTLVSALVQTVLENLTSRALREIGLGWGLKDELKRLESILRTVQLVLQDAEQRQRENKALQDWLLKLKDAAYDAEDILEEIIIEGVKRRRGMCHQLSSFSGPKQSLFNQKIARKVRIVRKRLDDIAEEKRNFHLTEDGLDNRNGVTTESRETISLVNEQEIVGRKEEKEMIIKTLLGTMLDDELSVYAIWGMGGLGKTTLAQLVYNDERAESHFDLRIWVCVSDDFSIKRILRAIIVSMDQGGCNSSELDPLQRYLQEKLRGKRFLLVLDDVWNEKDREWDVLKEVLRCGSRGSVLLVTTRIEKVASMMATIDICHLKYLSEADSWSLFSQRAFAAREVEESLTEIGKAIVKKCGGLPLAVRSLGSLMRTKSSEREWLAIEESGIWLPPEHENGILPALKLSYDNLPPHMRQCFAYCCIFPKDYLMNKDQLIELRMANGFLISEGQRDLYLKGHQIFKELVCRAFFEDVSGKTCKMHDLVHDLAKSVMKDETHVVEYGKALNIPKMPRHLSLEVSSGKMPLIASNSLHSLICRRHSLLYEEGNFSSFLSKQQSLRVLHLPEGFFFFTTSWKAGSRLSKLPNSIFKLEHLRYLAMSCFGQKKLPESLTVLHYLQTLKLSESDNLLELPKGLKHMKNLWFLDIESHRSLVCMPDGVGELTCLQRLIIFIVGQDPATQIDQLKELNLEGELSIQGLGNVRNLEDAKNANLMGKKNLTSLTLSWEKSSKENSAENFEEVLEGLRPYHNLQKLIIMSYQGSRFPNWMSTSAWKDLTEISLKGCHRCERLPTLGKLPSLTCLNLRNMDSIKHLDAEWHGNGETSFPTLTDLTIERMPNFQEWTIPDCGESFPCLKYLKITFCKKLNGLPSLRALHALLLEDCDSLTHFPGTILQGLSSLRSLQIHGCKRLNPLSVELQRESALEHLFISRCPEFKNFPESMQQLTSLRDLTIFNCEELRSLPNWLGRLQSLSKIVITGAKYLNSLPDGFRAPESLQSLRLYGCDPQLEERCKKPDGEDWPKISHIPKILINREFIQHPDL